MERLYKELENYGKSDFYPFHMPGHKRNLSCAEGEFPLERDITEIHGFDDLHHSEGILLEAQNALRDLYGTKESFFSVNGSTAGLLAAISASVRRGGQILVARNCHKAVYHGIYLRNLIPTYIYPQADIDLGINGGISAAHVERCLESNQEIEAVLITSPTYDGAVSDVEKIAEAAHRHGIPLIVDEAHGAHFRFSDYFPVSAVELGADVVIQSFHKTLPAMTQTAVVHVCSDRVRLDLLRRFLGIYQTSSPSYILMSSLDACVSVLEKKGSSMFQDFTENLQEVRSRLEKCRYIRLVPGTEELRKMQEKNVFFDFDRSKLIFSTAHSQINGPTLCRILREEFHLEMEMTTENYVLAMTTVGDTKEGLLRLCQAIEIIDSRVEVRISETSEAGEEKQENSCKCVPMKQLMTVSEAMESPTQLCLIEESVGKVSGEFVYLYPPGIPIVVPGELITGVFIRDVERYKEQGLNLYGLHGEKNEMICVVKEQAEV